MCAVRITVPRIMLAAALFILLVRPVSALQPADTLSDAFHADSSLHLQLGGAYVMSLTQGPATDGQPVTIKTNVAIGDLSAGVTEIILAGLGTVSGQSPDLASLVWVPGARNWFGQTWNLQLRTESPSVSAINLLTVAPVSGHDYETYLSYEPQSGAVSVMVTDLAGGAVYAGTHTLEPHIGSLWPIAGVRVASDSTPQTAQGSDAHDHVARFASVMSIGTVPLYLPVGDRWVVGSRSGTGSIVRVTRFERHEMIDVQLPSIPQGHGVFRLFSERADGSIDEVPYDEGLRIAASSLPWGTSSLILRFFGPDGELLLTDLQPVVIGRVQVQVDPLRVEGGHLRGAVRVVSDGPPSTASLRVDATLTRMTWDTTGANYVTEALPPMAIVAQPLTLSPAGATIPLDIPFPDPDLPGLWQITLDVHVDAGEIVSLSVSGELERLFSTHAPAQHLDTKPFTIVVLPDTQEYPKAYPHIFTRQTEWIAANAVELNIGAVLSVGDIVDNNDTTQWARAARSLHVLDGIVPYVLAVGNHDVRTFFSPQLSLFGREGSLINAYFSIDNARANSNLGGVFQPGRLENSYSLLSFGGDDYLALSLEWGPRDEVLEWADQVLTAYPSHKVIIVTHAFTAPDGGWVTPDRFPVALPPPDSFRPEPSTVNSAADIWDKLIDHHSNVFMVWSGHMGANAIAFRARVGKQGNTVFEMMTNYQTHPNGGNGWLVLATFTPDDRIIVQAFSPYLCMHRRDFDQYGFGHNFVIDVPKALYIPFNTQAYGHCGR